jgi:DUF2892 family protein
MKSVFGFLASLSGRIVRAAAGLVLIALGLGVVGGTWGTLIAILGIVPLAAGVFDFCLFGALLGFGFSGIQVRTRTA